MRAFIVFCLVAVAGADNMDYNYQPDDSPDSVAILASVAGGSIIRDGNTGAGKVGLVGGNNGGGNVDIIHGNAGSGIIGIDGGNTGSGSFGISGANTGSGSIGIMSGNIGSGSVGFVGGNIGSVGFGGTNNGGGDSPSFSTELDKEFYTFSAPEEEYDDTHAVQRAISSVKQSLRVVFIRGPQNKGLEDAALTLAKQAAQQQTAIYVLNKQSDVGDLANKLNNINKSANRPDVHFVKYRTSEDAANAQRAIQAQYDHLGGSSQSINGGIAPVLNFASASSAVHGAKSQYPRNGYLPTSGFRLRA